MQDNVDYYAMIMMLMFEKREFFIFKTNLTALIICKLI